MDNKSFGGGSNGNAISLFYRGQAGNGIIQRNRIIIQNKFFNPEGQVQFHRLGGRSFERKWLNEILTPIVSNVKRGVKIFSARIPICRAGE